MPNIKYRTELQRKKAIAAQQSKYSKEKCRFINVRFHKEYDKDVLDRLDSVPNKTDYLRRLILEDIKKEA